MGYMSQGAPTDDGTSQTESNTPAAYHSPGRHPSCFPHPNLIGIRTLSRWQSNTVLAAISQVHSVHPEYPWELRIRKISTMGTYTVYIPQIILKERGSSQTYTSRRSKRHSTLGKSNARSLSINYVVKRTSRMVRIALVFWVPYGPTCSTGTYIYYLILSVEHITIYNS